MAGYINYNNLTDIPLGEVDFIDGSGTTPGIDSEKVDIQSSTYNFPEIPDPTPEIAGRTTSIVRNATDHETITRTGGTIDRPDGTSFSISSGSKVMTSTTYFYLELSSSTIKTTTTSGDAVGAGKLLVAIGTPQTTPNKATFLAYGTDQSQQLVTHEYISPGAVDTVNIALGAVESQLIATDAITSTKIEDGAISTPKIATNAITAGKIATDAVTAGKIMAGAITSSKIDAGAVTTDKLDAGAVTAQKIASNTITANEIASNTITANQIATNTITANEINTNTITTLDLTSGTITGVTITGGLFRTASSGERVEITSSLGGGVGQNQINFYNSQNVEVASMKGGYSTGGSDPNDRFFITGANNAVFSIKGYDTRIEGTGRLLLDGKNGSIQIAGAGANTISIDPGSGGYTQFAEATYLNNTQVSGNITITGNTTARGVTTDNIRPSSSGSYNLGTSSLRRDTIYTYDINMNGSITGATFSGTTNFNTINASGRITASAGMQSGGNITPTSANSFSVGTISYPWKDLWIKTTSSGPAGRLSTQYSGGVVRLVWNDGSTNHVLT